MKTKLRSDDRGSVLILVMIAMTFVGLLGVVILSASMTNIKMKSVEQRAKVNFYSTESGLDQVKAALEGLASQKLELAYGKYLAVFTTKSSDSERRDAFQKAYLEGDGTNEGMIKALCDSTVNPLGTDYIKFLTDIKTKVPSVTTENGEAWMEVAADGKITIKNMEVSYQENGYQTTIKTDIVMELPELATSPVLATAAHVEIKDYSLIADLGIAAKNTIGMETQGSVYAGTQGIEVEAVNNAETLNYTIAGPKIITRQDIRIQDSAKLKLGYDMAPAGWNPLYQCKPDIWASNLIMEKKGEGNTSVNTNLLDITGRCYIENDFKINKKNSKVVFQPDSSYYGYSFNNGNVSGGAVEPDKSSAIFVNGANSSLDLSGIKDLVLNGRSFISEAYMGESLTTKNTQLAYLIPPKYMSDAVRINPMPETMYTAESAPGIENLLKVQDLKTDDIWQYLNETMPIKPFFLGAAGTPQMVYCYFNFKDQKSANEYFQKYYTKEEKNDEKSDEKTKENKKYVDDKTQPYMTGDGIKIRDAASRGRFNVAGNVLTYDVTSMQTQLIDATMANPDDPGTSSFNEANLYQKKYANLTTTLDDKKSGSGSVFETIIDTAKLSANVDAGTGAGQYKKMSSAVSGAIYIINNSGDVPFATLGAEDGIIVANGDVRVNSSFRGLILCGGSILMDAVSNEKTIADPDLVTALMNEALNTYNPAAPEDSVITYFKGYSPGAGAGGGGMVNPGGYITTSNYIYFENWKKNEE